MVYQDGVSTIAKYVFKLNGSYDLPWGIMVAGNFNMFQGATRTLTINGPGNVYGGINAAGAATDDQLHDAGVPESRDGFRFGDTRMLDLGVQKALHARRPLQAEADDGPVQRVQHQQHPDLFERQREPGRLHRAGLDHPAAGAAIRGESVLLRAVLTLLWRALCRNSAGCLAIRVGFALGGRENGSSDRSDVQRRRRAARPRPPRLVRPANSFRTAALEDPGAAR